MSVKAPHPAHLGGDVKATGAAALAREKIKPASCLKDESAEPRQERNKSGARLKAELVCQDENRTFAPFWDAPRLAPVFAAQLLGQVMPERRQTLSLETAYGRAACPRKALLLDRKS